MIVDGERHQRATEAEDKRKAQPAQAFHVRPIENDVAVDVRIILTNWTMA